MNPYWNIIIQTAKRSNYCPNLQQWKDLWPSFCGEPFCHVSTPCALVRKTLYIEVESKAWIIAFESKRVEIETLIQKLGWQVESLRWVLTSNAASSKAPRLASETIEPHQITNPTSDSLVPPIVSPDQILAHLNNNFSAQPTMSPIDEHKPSFKTDPHEHQS